jgi:hypothetical protein
MEEIKAILESLVSNCLKASNASDEDKKKTGKFRLNFYCPPDKKYARIIQN